MKTTLAQKILKWLEQLRFKGELPAGVELLEPYRPNTEALQLARTFYHKYYDDQKPRRLILGINPGRLGGGTTGIPFSDTRRLSEFCNITTSFRLHEPSSVFFYDVVAAAGGPAAFYHSFFVGAVCPLGLVQKTGSAVKNCNYYDSPEIFKVIEEFIVENLQAQIDLGMDSDEAICLGLGKNYQCLQRINQKHHFFRKITPLEHPRFIMQYRSRQKEEYVRKYLAVLGQKSVL